MKVPRIRFTVYGIMVAVAVLGFALAIERALYDAAAVTVASHAESFIFEEAMIVWVAYNVSFAVIALVPVIQLSSSNRPEDE